MIISCPNCGHNLPNGLVDGITFCENCQSSVDSSRTNRIMSAAWMAIQQKPEDIDRISVKLKLSEIEAILVEAFILDNCYTIEEFRLVIKELGIS